MLTAILLIIIALIIAYYVYAMPIEGFDSRHEKASTIYDWWTGENNPTYEKYKSDIDGSDVVEYSGVKRIASNGGLSIDGIMTVVN